MSALQATSVTLSIPDLPNGAPLENLGTTVEVVASEAGGTLEVGADSPLGALAGFRLEQFHFHLPSEHLDNGTSRAMEMHMVFEGEGGQVAVVAAFVDADGPGPVLEDVFSVVGDVAVPGSVATTPGLALSELARVLSAGQFQT